MKITKIAFVCLVIATVMLCGCDYKSGDAKDQYYDVMQSDDPHVLSVKKGHPVSYPEITYESASDFFLVIRHGNTLREQETNPIRYMMLWSLQGVAYTKKLK